MDSKIMTKIKVELQVPMFGQACLHANTKRSIAQESNK
jgi:hypothetical protein